MTYFSKILVFIIKALNHLDAKLTKHKYNSNPYHYEDLAPIDDIDDKNYLETLQWALRNNNIKNIALTAPYGAGKSSILRTFEKKNQQYNYLNISLAAFKDDDNQDSASIEKSILQQMFYKVENKIIPHSRFKKINNIKYIFLKSLFWMSWLFSTIILIKPEWIKNFQIPKDLTIFFLFLFIVGLYFIIKNTLKTFSNIKLHKINLKSPEIELSEDSEVSILNKHLDEILYFFEVTNYNVVIIEDLDRFEKPEIFTKLRELNALINNSEQINRQVTFIYAIRDNMFKDENRTKFFDFMIPVIPIINSSNSYEILQKKIEETGLDEVLDKEFISDVALYISDMRMLKNIYNEFVLYRNKLGNLDLDLNKLFAMIIYKNIYPSDFADLHDDKGMVYGIFRNKQQLVKKLTKTNDEEIEELKKNIVMIENQLLSNIDELKSVYLYKLIEQIPNMTHIRLNNQNHTMEQIKKDTLFKVLQNENNIYYYENRYGISSSNISFKAIEDLINPNISYDEREKLILSKQDNEIEAIKAKIETQEKLKQNIKSATTKELINDFGIKDILDEETQKEKLLTYLIRYGYIDEMYHTFISYFFEGSMTKEEMDFVLSIKNKEIQGFEYKLINIEELLKKIRTNEFSQVEILNYDLLDFMIENKDSYKEQLDILFLQLTNEHELQVRFIDGYLQHGKYKEYFIKTLAHKWQGLWRYIENISQYSTEKKNEYLRLLIIYADINDIVSMDKDLILSKYISQKSDFLSLIIEDEYLPKIEEVIDNLDIRFEYLNDPTSNQALFDFIYKNNLYIINEKMIKLLFEDEKHESLKVANYTTIFDSDKQHLQEYIQNNMELYLDNVFFKLATNIEEDEKTVIALLNNENISYTYKKNIIISQNATISSIVDVPDIQWKVLFEDDKVQATWANVLHYYEKIESFDSALLGYLNIKAHYTELSKTKLQTSETFDEDFIKKISKEILLASDISDTSFKYLLKSIPFTYNSLTLEGLSEEKIKTMVETKFLNLTLDNFNELKENFPNHYINLIEQHIDDFIEVQTEYELTENDFKRLFDSTKISTEQKFVIINSMDIGFVTNEVAMQIYNIVRSSPIDDAFIFEKIEKLLECDIDIEEKINIFTKYIEKMDENHIMTLLTLLGEPYSELTEKGIQPKIENNEHNKNLIIKLNEYGYISSFKEEKKKLRIYTKRS